MNDSEDVETVPITEVLLIDENGVILNQQAFGNNVTSPTETENDIDYDELEEEDEDLREDFELDDELIDEDEEIDSLLGDEVNDIDSLPGDGTNEIGGQFLLNGIPVKRIKIEAPTERQVQTVNEDMEVLFTSTYHRKKEKVTCPVCSLVFTGAGSLMNHLRYKHSPRIDQPLCCEKCGRTFKYPSKYKRHAERKDCTERVQSFACLLCEFITDTTELIMNHYSKQHDLDMTKTEVNFSSEAEFDAWREKFCMEHQTSFAIQSGSRANSKGSRIVVYRCHRDGFYRPKGFNKRRIKALGSNKMNGRCPAHIHAKFGKDGVQAYYVNTHVGHGTELARLRLTKTERDMVAQKLAGKVPMKEILDSVRDSVKGNNVSRIHLLSRVDLHNLCRSYGLSKDSFKAEKIDITTWVEESQSKIVKFYKPKGVVLKEFPLLSVDDFYLVLMSEAQISAMSQYASEYVCVDGLQGSNDYEYNLYTIMVIQQNMKCLPCAFMFTNKEDEMALELMFDRVKAAIGGEPVCTSCFFSDVNDTYYSAWCSAMAPPKSRFFLPWCVDNDWRDNLSTISNQETLVGVYRRLKLIMEEHDTSAFDMQLVELNKELNSEKDTAEFGRYFDAKYADEPSTWAWCYIAAAGITTTAHLENAHRVLSHIYTKGRQARRLDRTVPALMKFAKESLVEVKPRRGRGAKGKAARHAAGLAIAPSRIAQDADGVWIVSGHGRESSHSLQFPSILERECNCASRCNDCDACVHSLTCTCTDHAHGHMCKHAHAVCQVMQDSGDREFQLILDSDNVEPEIFIEYVSVEDGDEIVMDDSQVLASINEHNSIEDEGSEVTHIVIREPCEEIVKNEQIEIKMESNEVEEEEREEYDGVETDGHIVQIEDAEDWPSLRADLKEFSDHIISSISDVDSYQLFRGTLIQLKKHICK